MKKYSETDGGIGVKQRELSSEKYYRYRIIVFHM